MPQSSRGRGWFGDSQGHSKAGRKGGQARGRRASMNNRENSSTSR